MPERSSYPPGTPSWVDLMSPDLEASKRFYAGLFGWEAAVAPDPAAGGYTTFLSNGRAVAGAGPLFMEGAHPAWSTYIATDDADATAAAARGAGGTVSMEPFDVLQVGRMAVLQDPAGAFISIWQPREHRGAELVNEPNALSWNELATRDPAAAKAFYGAVFGWKPDDMPMGGGADYTIFKLGEAPVAGMVPMGDQLPSEVPPHWLVYFSVEDCDASVATAKELGATVLMEPMDLPGVGRFAPIRDPQGAVFAVIASAPPPG